MTKNLVRIFLSLSPSLYVPEKDNKKKLLSVIFVSFLSLFLLTLLVLPAICSNLSSRLLAAFLFFLPSVCTVSAEFSKPSFSMSLKLSLLIVINSYFVIPNFLKTPFLTFYVHGILNIRPQNNSQFFYLFYSWQNYLAFSVI